MKPMIILMIGGIMAAIFCGISVFVWLEFDRTGSAGFAAFNALIAINLFICSAVEYIKEKL